MPDTMSHSFKISLNDSPASVLQKVGEAIRSGGGIFQGDMEKGSFSGDTVLGIVRGEYRCLPDNNIIITITGKPFLVPYSMIESEIRQYFG